MTEIQNTWIAYGDSDDGEASTDNHYKKEYIIKHKITGEIRRI